MQWATKRLATLESRVAEALSETIEYWRDGDREGEGEGECVCVSVCL